MGIVSGANRIFRKALSLGLNKNIVHRHVGRIISNPNKTITEMDVVETNIRVLVGAVQRDDTNRSIPQENAWNIKFMVSDIPTPLDRADSFIINGDRWQIAQIRDRDIGMIYNVDIFWSTTR